MINEHESDANQAHHHHQDEKFNGSVDHESEVAAAEAAAALDREPRKFFPRVKLLLSTHYEPLLKGVLQVVEASNCAHCPTATTTNAWQVAFDASYNTVLSEFSLPSGKNRYHKFRDKIVEIWKAMQDRVQEYDEEEEVMSADDEALYELAGKQYDIFLAATEERKVAGKQYDTYLQATDERKVAGVAADGCATKDRKQPPPPIAPSVSKDTAGTAPETPEAASASVPAANTNTGTAATTNIASTKKRPAVAAPPMSHATQRATAAASSINKSDWQEKILSKLETITVLLQTANTNPQMPLKLPSMLNDLHRIRIRTTDTGELAILKPYYHDLLNNYLQAIEYKIRAGTIPVVHPAALVIDLEGMDLLRHGLRDDPEMLEMVQTTYRRVLIKYLKSVNPHIPPMSPQRKRPRGA